MRRIAEPQRRPAGAQLDLVAIEQRHGIADALVIDQRAVEALQIDDGKLIARPANFRVPPRDDRGVGINYYFAFGITTETRDFLR
jgi:hypothetical protein